MVRAAASRATKASSAAKKRRRAPSDSSSDDEQELVSDTRRGRGKRQKASAILAEFSSLDALLSNDQAEKRKRDNRERKMQKLREESEATDKDASEGGSSPLGKLMNHMASNMSTLSGDSHLFSGSEVAVAEEKFGYVFTPITEPLPYRTYKATETELKSDIKLVYEAMQSMDVIELSGLLWSKAILVRCMLTHPAKSTTRSAATPTPVALPSKIGSWLFMTMSTHSDSHVAGGCFSNLFLTLSSVSKASIPSLSAALPVACFAHPIEDFRSAFGTQVPAIEMEWRPTIYDFLNAFRAYGFQDSKRSMSVKSKIPVTPPSSKKLRVLPFPTLNMHYVLMFLVICLRTKTLSLEGYDAFSFTMFFLRMQFENDIHASIVDLATICIEELLDAFPRAEWRREWAPQLVLRIAGANEGLFDSAAGWLAVARRLPRTMRGTQLTTGLSIYVLQHRIDIKPLEGATSERPLKFPIQSGLVVDIVAGIVDDLTRKYAETRKNGKSAKTTPPFDLLCKKVALMDLALQAFLNILTPKEMKIMLNKLDQLADAHKSTMSAKWHELKTLLSKMEQGRSLQAALQFMERNGRALEELVARMLKAREEQEAFLGAFAKSLEDIAAQEECTPLAQVLGGLSDCGQKLASESHDVMLLRPETGILQAVTQIQDWAIVPMKRLLEDREKAIKIEAKLQKEYDDMRRGSSAKEKKLRMLSDQKRRVENVNALLEIHMESFDRYRIQKMKKIVSELARSQAFYHAKGLELFAVPCQAIAKLNPSDVMKVTTQANPADAS